MKNILLIGLGRFGRHVAIHLNEMGYQIMAVDKAEDKVNECIDYVTSAVIGDSTNRDFLKSLGIANYDVCFVTIGGNFQNSLETTYQLKELGAKCVISRAERDVQAKFLERNGADHVVYPERQMAKWTAIRYAADHIFDYMELDAEHGVFETEVPEEWLGKTISELDIRKKFNLNILGIKSNGKLTVNLTPDTTFEKNSTILVLGDYRNLEKCFKKQKA